MTLMVTKPFMKEYDQLNAGLKSCIQQEIDFLLRTMRDDPAGWIRGYDKIEGVARNTSGKFIELEVGHKNRIVAHAARDVTLGRILLQHDANKLRKAADTTWRSLGTAVEAPDEILSRCCVVADRAAFHRSGAGLLMLEGRGAARRTPLGGATPDRCRLRARSGLVVGSGRRRGLE